MSTNSDSDYTGTLLWTPPYQDQDVEEIDGEEEGININNEVVRSMTTTTTTAAVATTTTGSCSASTINQDHIVEEGVFDQAVEYMDIDISEFMKNQNDFMIGNTDDVINEITLSSTIHSSLIPTIASGGETTQESSLDDSDDYGESENKTDDDDLDTSMEDRELVINDPNNESLGDSTTESTDYEEALGCGQDQGISIDEINLYSQSSYKAATSTTDDESTLESSQDDENENENENDGDLDSSIEEREELIINEQNHDTLGRNDSIIDYEYLMQPSDQSIGEISLYSSSILKTTDDEEEETAQESSQEEEDNDTFGEGFEILGEIINVPNQTSDSDYNYDENKGNEEDIEIDQETEEDTIEENDEGTELIKEEDKPHVEPTLKSLLIQFKEEFEKKEQKYEESLSQSWLSDLFPQFQLSGYDSNKREKNLGIPFFAPAHEDEDDELLLGYKSRPTFNHKSMCLLCYKWVLDEKELAEHMGSKHPQLYFYKCRICFKRFLAPFQRSRHEKIHKYDMKFPLNFYTPSEDLPLDYYVPNHWRKRLRPALFTYSYINSLEESVKQKWDCIMCDLIFNNVEDLTEHYDLAHKAQECQYCYEKFENGIEFQKHLKIVHKIEPHVNYKGGMFAVLNDMEERYAFLMSTIEEDHCYTRPRHEEFRNGTKRHRKVPRRNYYDSEDEARKAFCNLGSTSSSGGVTLIERRARRRDNFCKLCSEDFVTPENYVRHMANVHATEKPYACSYCYRRFGTQSNKKEHERIHTGEKPYKCVICERGGFTQISNLKKHISTHGEENHLKCQVCAKQFIKETSLILHQRAHAADRKYKCTICHRAYNYSSLLNRHMRLHTGENPYSCYDCGKMFHESLLLDYHIKKYHTGERIKCVHCEKAFILTSDLKKHLKIHARQGLPMPSDFMSDDDDDDEGEQEEEGEYEEGSFLEKDMSTEEEEEYIVEVEPEEK